MIEAKPDALAAELAKQPGGLSLDEVSRLALKYKPSLRAKQAELQAAAARVDQAFVNYFPRVSVAFTYTRLSEVVNSLGSGALLGAATPGLVVSNPCPAPDPTNPQKQCVYTQGTDGTLSPVGAQAINFPVITDSYSFTAALAVPVSDYLLRISQGHAAASHAEKAKKVELEAETLASAADAKVAYLNWVRTKGQAFVAKQAVDLAKAHVEDVKRVKAAGLASQADVLRGEAQVAAAEQAFVEVSAFASIAEEQVRIGLNLPKGQALTIGIDVMNIAPPASLPQLSTLQDQAMDKRLEIRALDETEVSLKDAESVARAGFYPRVDLFADLQVASPNQRYSFAPAGEFNTTWDAGVRVSWTLNDTFTTIGAASEAKSRVTQIAEQKKVLRDGLKLEVAAAYAEIKKSGAQIDAATRGLVASEEGLRVRRELFLQGKATNVEMLDSEIEVTRARLRRLDAQIGLIVAQIKYDHAIGNDVDAHKPADAADKKSDDDASSKKVTNVAAVVTPPLGPVAK